MSITSMNAITRAPSVSDDLILTPIKKDEHGDGVLRISGEMAYLTDTEGPGTTPPSLDSSPSVLQSQLQTPPVWHHLAAEMEEDQEGLLSLSTQSVLDATIGPSEDGHDRANPRRGNPLENSANSSDEEDDDDDDASLKEARARGSLLPFSHSPQLLSDEDAMDLLGIFLKPQPPAAPTLGSLHPFHAQGRRDSSLPRLHGKDGSAPSNQSFSTQSGVHAGLLGGRVSFLYPPSLDGGRTGMDLPSIGSKSPETSTRSRPQLSQSHYKPAQSCASLTAPVPFVVNSVLTKQRKGDRPTINRYVVQKAIGMGACGRVLAAMDPVAKRRVAIKIVARADKKKRIGGPTNAQRNYEAFMSEIEIMKKLRHRNIVSVYEVIDDPEADKVYLVMQYINHGSIAQLEVKAGTDKVCEPIPADQLAYYAREMLAGLGYLHRHDVVHRDLKPDNILVSKDGHVYLADFGVAETLDRDYKKRREAMMEQSMAMSMAMSVAGGRACGPQVVGTKGTPLFLSPELWNGEQSYGKPVDMWAMGVTLYTLLTGQLPFSNPEEIRNARYQIPLPSVVTPPWVKLLHHLLERDVAKRWTVDEARAYVKTNLNPPAHLLRAVEHCDESLETMDCATSGSHAGTPLMQGSTCSSLSELLEVSERVNSMSTGCEQSLEEVEFLDLGSFAITQESQHSHVEVAAEELVLPAVLEPLPGKEGGKLATPVLLGVVPTVGTEAEAMIHLSVYSTVSLEGPDGEMARVHPSPKVRRPVPPLQALQRLQHHHARHGGERPAPEGRGRRVHRAVPSFLEPMDGMLKSTSSLTLPRVGSTASNGAAAQSMNHIGPTPPPPREKRGRIFSIVGRGSAAAALEGQADWVNHVTIVKP